MYYVDILRSSNSWIVWMVLTTIIARFYELLTFSPQIFISIVYFLEGCCIFWKQSLRFSLSFCSICRLMVCCYYRSICWRYMPVSQAICFLHTLNKNYFDLTNLVRVMVGTISIDIVTFARRFCVCFWIFKIPFVA